MLPSSTTPGFTHVPRWSPLGLFCLGGLLLSSAAQAQVPTPTAITPKPNTIAAPTTTPVTVSFNQPLGTGTSTQNGLKVFSHQAGGKKAGTTTVSGNTLSFVPATPFKAGETVFSTLTTGVQSSSQQALAKPYVFQFTTATKPSAGTFGAGSDVQIGAPSNGFRDVTTGDVDADGDLDLLNVSGSNIIIQLNDGNGSFSSATTVPSVGGATFRALAVGDVDSDGDLDLITSNLANRSGAVNVHLNNGTGGFTLLSTVSNSTAPGNLVLGDVDGDGDLDLVADSGSGPTVLLFKNDGTGRLGAGVAINNVGGLGLALGDLDGDGDLDLVSSNSSNNLAYVRFNDGQGTFSGEAATTVTQPGQVALGDVDADGDLDVVVANRAYQAGSAVSILFNNGSGALSTPSVVPLDGGVTNDVVLGDVDGDGDLDFATAKNSKVIVRLNDSHGVFSTGPDLTISSSEALALTLGDLDSDGTLDLAVANSNTTASIRLNPATPSTSPCANDKQAPTVRAAGFAINLVNGQATIQPEDVDGDSYDDCGKVTLALDKSSFTCANVGINAVTLTVTDQNGNVARQTVDILVRGDGTCNSDPCANDTQAPVIVGAGFAINLVNGQATIQPEDVDGGSYDNCGDVSLALDKSSFTCANIGLNPVTLIVTDKHGNVARQTFDILVRGDGTCTTPALAADQLNVYPNPAVNSVRLRITDLTTGALVNVYNGQGTRVLTQALTSADQLVDLSALPTGVYLLKVNNGSQVLTQRVVKN
jgi:hypothetical protein